MTDKIDTVQDDENGSFEGRLAIIDQAMFSIPVASTIFLSFDNRFGLPCWDSVVSSCFDGLSMRKIRVIARR